MPRFDPARRSRSIARDRVTVFEGVPTMYAALLNRPGPGDDDRSPARCACPAARPCRWRCCAASRTRSAASILEGYGLSETSPVASFNHPDRERKPGSIGTPIEGVEMRLVGADGGDVARRRGRRDRDPRATT